VVSLRIEFVLLVCVAVATAFGHFAIIKFLRGLGAKGKWEYWLVVVWLALGVLGWVTLHKASELWQLAALLAEISGAAILAAEVLFAHKLEKLRSIVQEFVEVAAIKRPGNPIPTTAADFQECLSFMGEVYSIQGVEMPEAERSAILGGDEKALGDLLVFISLREPLLAKQRRNLVDSERFGVQYGPKMVWVGLLLIVAALTGHGLHAILSEPATEEAKTVIQRFFLAGTKVQYDSGIAIPRDDTGICDAKKKLAEGHSTVALVVARHDQMPLGLSARLKFSTNAGLAQLRAEGVAESLRRTDECGPGIPNVIALVRSPRHVGAASRNPRDLQDDREVEIYGVGDGRIRDIARR
jgi:hypothetical protein